MKTGHLAIQPFTPPAKGMGRHVVGVAERRGVVLPVMPLSVEA
jgi:chemotaxis signal transduction protein